MSMIDLSLLHKLGLPPVAPTFFPEPLERFRQSQSAATGTPDEYAVAYMLTAVGAATGGYVSARVQGGWNTRANIFAAIIGNKGSGKSTLSGKVFAPLVAYEDELREQAADEADLLADDEADDDGGSSGSGRSRRGRPEPCVIVNDVTGPAVLKLLEHNRRQLLVNTDELSSAFARNGGGIERQTLCELYDGRRRRRHRAADNRGSSILESPYVSMIGSIQPGLLKMAYNSKGDDGLLDRFLLVGLPKTQRPRWPTDADDPGLNEIWREVINRLLQIEFLAADAKDGVLHVAFRPEAVEVHKHFDERLHEIAMSIGVPDEQQGVVAKLRGHAVRLALVHRCLRWAAGSFGADGPLGDVDDEDAVAACEATAFFFGRWLMWRPELGAVLPSNVALVGLREEPGGDPALEALAATASAAQAGIRLIERLVGYLRLRDGHASLADMLATGPLTTAKPEELGDACSWLVEHGQALWGDDGGSIRLVAPKFGKLRKRRIGRRCAVAT
jgi:hypothetical protein